MKWTLAFKAFFKALKDPKKAESFVEDKKQIEMPSDPAHLRLLSYLQQNGRLIDFLKEDLTSFTDTQVGAAVRKIHQDCKQTLEELVTIRPLKEENEGASIHVPKGFNPSEIKVVGKIKGEPPYTGILIHKGWKAHKRSLPKKTDEYSGDIICPAEIEVK